MSFDIGDVVTLDFTDTVDGVLTDPTALTLTITLPDGTTVTPSTTHVSTGTYKATYVPTMNGLHSYTWQATGTAQSTERGSFRVGLGFGVAEVKTALNKNLTVDDVEIQRMLDSACAEYEQWVGPLPSAVTEKLNGGGATLLLRSPNVTAITTAAYTDGTTITLTDLDLTSSGIVGWGYGTTGVFTRGTRNVTVTYTVGEVPLNHVEAIIADVAGYFEMTQEGPAGPDDGYALGNRGAPLVLFPRIRALAVPGVA